MSAVGAEFKGKAKSVPFYKQPSAPAPQPKEKHWPILVGGALAGAAILLLLRNRSSGTTGTGSVLTVYPSGQADTSQITNMQGTIQAILNNPNTGQSVTTGPTPDSQNSVTGGATPTPTTAPITLTPQPFVMDYAVGHSVAPGLTSYGANFFNGLSASDQQKILTAAGGGPAWDQGFFINAVAGYMAPTDPFSSYAPYGGTRENPHPPTTLDQAIANAISARNSPSAKSVAAGL